MSYLSVPQDQPKRSFFVQEAFHSLHCADGDVALAPADGTVMGWKRAELCNAAYLEGDEHGAQQSCAQHCACVTLHATFLAATAPQ
jgi:hypothetical protein